MALVVLVVLPHLQSLVLHLGRRDQVDHLVLLNLDFLADQIHLFHLLVQQDQSVLLVQMVLLGLDCLFPLVLLVDQETLKVQWVLQVPFLLFPQVHQESLVLQWALMVLQGLGLLLDPQVLLDPFHLKGPGILQVQLVLMVLALHSLP